MMGIQRNEINEILPYNTLAIQRLFTYRHRLISGQCKKAILLFV